MAFAISNALLARRLPVVLRLGNWEPSAIRSHDYQRSNLLSDGRGQRRPPEMKRHSSSTLLCGTTARICATRSCERLSRDLRQRLVMSPVYAKASTGLSTNGESFATGERMLSRGFNPKSAPEQVSTH